MNIRLFVPDGLGSGPNFIPVKWYKTILTGTIPLLLFCLYQSKLLIKWENQENESLRNINQVCYITFFHINVVISIEIHCNVEVKYFVDFKIRENYDAYLYLNYSAAFYSNYE